MKYCIYFPFKVPCQEGKESNAMKELFKVLKDHSNRFMQQLVTASYQHCFISEMENESTNNAARDRRLAHQRRMLVDLGVVEESEARELIVDPDEQLPASLERKKEEALEHRRALRASKQQHENGEGEAGLHESLASRHGKGDG